MSDQIKGIAETIKRIGAASQEVADAWAKFVDKPERLTWPVMWCRDHEQLESMPGCTLNRARRGI